jgi:hypothetical protein
MIHVDQERPLCGIVEFRPTDFEFHQKCDRGRADLRDLSVVAARPRHGSLPRADPPGPSPRVERAHENSLNDLALPINPATASRFLPKDRRLLPLWLH